MPKIDRKILRTIQTGCYKIKFLNPELVDYYIVRITFGNKIVNNHNAIREIESTFPKWESVKTGITWYFKTDKFDEVKDKAILDKIVSKYIPGHTGEAVVIKKGKPRYPLKIETEMEPQKENNNSTPAAVNPPKPEPKQQNPVENKTVHPKLVSKKKEQPVSEASAAVLKDRMLIGNTTVTIVKTNEQFVLKDNDYNYVILERLNAFSSEQQQVIKIDYNELHDQFKSGSITISIFTEYNKVLFDLAVADLRDQYRQREEKHYKDAEARRQHLQKIAREQALRLKGY